MKLILLTITVLVSSPLALAGGIESKPRSEALDVELISAPEAAAVVRASATELDGGIESIVRRTEAIRFASASGANLDSGIDLIIQQAALNVRSIKFIGETGHSVVLMINGAQKLIEIEISELEAAPALYNRVNEAAGTDAWVQTL